MKQRTKLLLTIPHLGGGGAERVIGLLAQHLDPERFEIHLAVITEDAPGAQPPPASVVLHRLNKPRVRSAWLSLLHLIRIVRPDVVLAGIAHLNFLILLLKPLLPRRTRILVRQNTTGSAAAANWLTRLAYRCLYPRADQVICQSQAMADDLVTHFGLSPGRLTVLANPISRSEDMPPPYLASPVESGPHLLCVGRLSAEKGVDLLIQAMAKMVQIKPAYPKLRLTILGIGREEPALRRLAAELGLSDTICFQGYANPAPYFVAATLFVLPSRYEGMPNALLEASAAGLPIVATPCSAGVTELLAEVPGCWLSPAISAEALAATLLTALDALQAEPARRFKHEFLAPFELAPSIAAYSALIENTAHPRRIAMLIPTLDQIGGAERQVILLSKELARRGWQATLLTLSGTGDGVAAELTAANVSYISLGMRKAWIDPRGWLRYLAWHRHHRAAILHAHLPHATWFARCSRLIAPAPILVDTIHTSKTGSRARRWGYKLSHWLTTQVTCVSQAVAAAVQTAGMARSVKVVPNGVPLPPYDLSARPEDETPFRWIAVGRLAPVKDYPTLLRAFAALPCAPTLQIAGTGPDEANLRTLARQLGIVCRVDFAGFHADIQPLLAHADGFVLSSLWEGLPVSVLEASAAGLPIVATGAAGTREAMIPGKSGLLVPVGDVVALTNAMARIMTLPRAERLRMGANGRQFVAETRSIEKVADRWEQLYASLQSSHPNPRLWG
jgi:glycosyltransferase involved in cell wall biosynthesis